MKHCKYCGAEMEDALTVCPGCGRDQTMEPPEEEIKEEAVEAPAEEIREEAVDSPAAEAEQTASTPESEPAPAEGKKGLSKASAIALAVAAVVLLAALLTVLVMNGKKEAQALPTEETAQAAEETQPMTIPADGNPDDVTCKGTYTASDEEAIAERDRVVATSGSCTLTNGQLQVHYWLTVQQFYAQYGSYAPYFGLDHTLPMDTQVCGMADNRTWQQYFLEQALDSWQVYEAVAQEAERNGFQLPEEAEKELQELEAGLNETALANGFDDASHMLRVNFGSAVTLQDYEDYWRLYYSGSHYYSEVLESIAPSEAEVEAFFAEHEAAYKDKGLTKDTRTVDVRHILVTPENPNEDGTYSQESWAKAEQKAQELLDTYLSGERTEERFAGMANESSQDPGSNTNGGLYTGVTLGQMVAPFEDWCFDTSRAAGDTGIVKTDYGYHVMYFVGSQTIWQSQAATDLLTQKSEEFLEQARAAVETKIDYSAIRLALVDMS